MARLAGKVAVVTGGAGGIGSAAAQLFAEEGAKVLIVDRDAEAVQRALAAIDRDGVEGCAADVADPQQVERYTRTAVERFGGLDILLLNAGQFGRLNTLDDYPLALWDQVVATNLRGSYLGLRAAVPEMKRRGGGSIVITSSIQGLSAFPLSSPYTCSKHAVVGLMRNAALELARHNIRVNSVHPGFTDTDMMGGLHRAASPDAPEAAMEAFAKTLPMRRYAKPREIAHVMLFLASDDASYCSGATFVADGATLASWTPTPD